jgi:hypothetical protein
MKDLAMSSPKTMNGNVTHMLLVSFFLSCIDTNGTHRAPNARTTPEASGIARNCWRIGNSYMPPGPKSRHDNTLSPNG